MAEPERIHRAARALQAMHRAMNAPPPRVPLDMPRDQAFELHYAAQELNFSAVMSFKDSEAMAPECYDPTVRGGWAWWAKRILDAADEQ